MSSKKIKMLVQIKKVEAANGIGQFHVVFSLKGAWKDKVSLDEIAKMSLKETPVTIEMTPVQPTLKNKNKANELDLSRKDAKK